VEKEKLIASVSREGHPPIRVEVTPSYVSLCKVINGEQLTMFESSLTEDLALDVVAAIFSVVSAVVFVGYHSGVTSELFLKWSPHAGFALTTSGKSASINIDIQGDEWPTRSLTTIADRRFLETTKVEMADRISQTLIDIETVLKSVLTQFTQHERNEA
jgi:hypothetical protein